MPSLRPVRRARPEGLAELGSLGHNTTYDISCFSRNRCGSLVGQHVRMRISLSLELGVRSGTLLAGRHSVNCRPRARVFGDDAISRRCLKDRERSVTVAL